MTVRIKNNSRLFFSELFVTAGVEYWGLPEYPDVEARDDDILHEVVEHDRIDKLASDYYGDPVLWWVIARANGLKLIPADLKVGSELRIPSPLYVSSILMRRRLR
jgi:nucleoid-associated protein YgaU